MIYLVLILVGFSLCLSFSAFAAIGFTAKQVTALDKRVSAIEQQNQTGGGGGAAGHPTKPTFVEAPTYKGKLSLN